MTRGDEHIPVVMLIQLLELKEGETISAEACLRVRLLDALNRIRYLRKFDAIFVPGSLEEEARNG